MNIYLDSMFLITSSVKELKTKSNVFTTLSLNVDFLVNIKK